jgi:hypothetical protein
MNGSKKIAGERKRKSAAERKLRMKANEHPHRPIDRCRVRGDAP